VRRIANEVGVEIEIARHGDAADGCRSADRVGTRDRVAECPAPQVRVVVDDVLAQAPDELSMWRPEEAVVNEIAANARSGLAAETDIADAARVEGIVEERAGVFRVLEIRWLLNVQVVRSLSEKARIDRHAQRQRRFVKLVAEQRIDS